MGHNSSKQTTKGVSSTRETHKRKSKYHHLSENGTSQQTAVPATTVLGDKGTNSVSTEKPSFSFISSGSKQEQLDKYFSKYKDEYEDAILAEGMERFCTDLGVDPTEYVVLLLAWKFEASQMARFTREEFVNGCQKMRVHDAKSLCARFPEMREEVKKDDSAFQDLYKFTFTFGLDHSQGQRSLPIDMAISLWQLVFEQHPTSFLQPWCDFLTETKVKGISRDTWNLFLPFCRTVRTDFSDYDESEAWPSLFDDFVEYRKQCRQT